MASQVAGQSIPFVSVSENENSDNNLSHSFSLTPEAMQLLTSIGDRNIAILVIAGPSRSGKSFIANRFLKQMKGFQIGPTTNPCTKGIWAWSKPIRLNETTDLIILDTEGLNSVQRDSTVDMKIFSISVLLASSFLYNSIGHIDEKAIENLSLVGKLSEHIAVSKSSVSDGSSLLGEFFPDFCWVLRDFSLDLKGVSPQEYLEGCLRARMGESNDTARKNDIRDKFKTFFRVRDCETLVRPLDEESQLAHIEDQEWLSLRPAFIEGVNNLEKKLIANIRPKTIRSKVLTGKMFLGIALEYLQAIGSGEVPTILTSLESVISSQIRKVFEEVRGDFIKNYSEKFSADILPLDDEEFLKRHKEITTETFNSLQAKSRVFIDADQLIALRSSMQAVIDDEFTKRFAANQEFAKNASTKALLNLVSRLPLPTFTHFDQITPNFVIDKLDEVQKLLSAYSAASCGSAKFPIFFKQFPQKVFEYFNLIATKISTLASEDHQKTKVKLFQATESTELVRGQISLYENLTLDLQREVEKWKGENEELRRDQVWQKKTQESNEKSKFGRIEELEKQVSKKKEKIAKFKKECFDNQECLHKTRIELNQKKIENQGLRKEIEEVKRLSRTSGNSGEHSANEHIPDLISSIRDLKNQVQYMDGFFSCRSSLTSSLNSQETQFQDFEQSRMEKLNLKKEYKAKIDSYRMQFDTERQDLLKKIEIQAKYIDSIKAENMGLISLTDDLKKKALTVSNLLSENENLRESISAKQVSLDTATQVLEEFTKQIEKAQSVKLGLENQLAYIKSENCKLMSFKESYPYILRESLKYVLNRNCKLKHSLKQLNDEDIIQVRDCFTEVGVDIKI